MIAIMSDWRTLFAHGDRKRLVAGQTLFRQGDAVTRACLVRAGAVALERPLPGGEPLVLSVARDGALLAEASLFAAAYHCDAVARSDSEILTLARPVFMARLGERPDAALALLSETAREVQRLRGRIEILRLRRVSDRLDAWLDLHGDPGPGARWADVAEAIGVTPEALYRERARRRGSLALPRDLR